MNEFETREENYYNFHGFFDSLFKQEEKVSFGFYSQFSGHIYCKYKVESKWKNELASQWMNN